MKLILSTILSIFTLLSFAQTGYKFDKKTKIVYENEISLFEVKDLGDDSYSIRNSLGKELIYLKIRSFKDPKEVSSSNTSGEVIYTTVNFYNTDSSCELDMFGGSKHYAEIVYKNKLIVNGELDPSAEERFIKINGNNFTKQRDKQDVIIINNNPPAQQQQDGIQIKKNGVNISIGH